MRSIAWWVATGVAATVLALNIAGELELGYCRSLDRLLPGVDGHVDGDRSLRLGGAAGRENGNAHVEIRDDGTGVGTPDGGAGLRGLAYRVGALDGKLTIQSPPGGATRIVAEIPCHAVSAAREPADQGFPGCVRVAWVSGSRA